MRLLTTLSTLALLALGACSSAEEGTTAAPADNEAATEVADAGEAAAEEAAEAEPLPEVRYYLLSTA